MCTRLTKLTLFAVVTLTVRVPGPAAGGALEQPANTWVKRSPLENTPTSPRLGYEGACAWDSAHHLLIRYGGHNQGGGGAQYSEVWTFDPVTAVWTLNEPDISPPGVCCAQQNVYDPVHGRYVRFPAFSGSHGWQWFREIYLNNSTVWVYDLDSNRWRDLRPVPAPAVSPLRCTSWDCDAQVVVLFGGEGNREGTVVYDPYTNTWTHMKPAAEPAFRSGGNMVYDSARKLHIMFGSQFTDDPHTWGYDLRRNEWRDLKPPQMPPTSQNDAVLTYDSQNKVVVAIVKLTEGQDENAKHRLQTWVYDAGDNTWRKMSPPREPDATGNRSRVLAYAAELGLCILENRTRSQPGPPEQQIWTYCYAPPKPDLRQQLPPPAQVRVTTTGDGARIRWKPDLSSGATAYHVYRGTAAQPWEVDYEKIGSVDANRREFLDAGLDRGTVYYYAVRTAADGRLSEPSLKVRTQPRIVEEVVVSVLSENQVYIGWEPRGASDIAGYHVERADVEVWTEDQLKRLKSRVQPLAEPSIGSVRRIGPFRRITSSLLKDTFLRDTVDLTKPNPAAGEAAMEPHFYDEHLDRAGKEYRFAVFAYRVRAVNALGVRSGPSPYYLTVPSAPRRVFAREDRTSCRIKWARNPERKLAGYRIYRLDGRWDKDRISRMTAEPVTDLTFSDATAGDRTRRYHVVAVDALGQEGLPSAPVWYRREWQRFYEPFVGDWHQ